MNPVKHAHRIFKVQRLGSITLRAQHTKDFQIWTSKYSTEIQNFKQQIRDLGGKTTFTKDTNNQPLHTGSCPTTTRPRGTS